MSISRIVRIGAVVAAVAVVSACTSGLGAETAATTTAPVTTTAQTGASGAPVTAGTTTLSIMTESSNTSTNAGSNPESAGSFAATGSSGVPGTAASSGVAGRAAPSAGSTVASSQTSFGVTYVGVTSDWTGDQLFTKPRSDGTPVAPALYGSGVSAQFQSPSGNITCQIQVDTPNGSSDGAVCQINVHGYGDPEPPADVKCSRDYGRAVQILPVGVKVECPIPVGASNPGAGGTPLGAGSQLDFGGVTCLSTDYGIRCLDNDRQVGFMIGENILATIEP